jgi:ribosomal protein S6--L-glutamate ligase
VGRRVRLSREERTTAEAAATILGLDVAGVDLLRTTQGPLVLEVNAVPGLEGIETTTGLDLAGAMIEALEEKIRRRSSRSSPAATGDSRCRPPS